jgi:hypothetical protein
MGRPYEHNFFVASLKGINECQGFFCSWHLSRRNLSLSYAAEFPAFCCGRAELPSPATRVRAFLVCLQPSLSSQAPPDMNNVPSKTSTAPQFGFLRNGDAAPSLLDWDTGPEVVRKAIGEALNARHVAFLIGAGCSSLIRDGAEVGIATMMPLAKEFCGITKAASVQGPMPAESAKPGPLPPWRLSEEERAYLDEMGISLSAPEYQRNLERLMEALYSLHFILSRSLKQAHKNRAETVGAMIEKVKQFLLERCTTGSFARGDSRVLELYEQFYRKLVLRDRSLPRPWVRSPPTGCTVRSRCRFFAC